MFGRTISSILLIVLAAILVQTQPAGTQEGPIRESWFAPPYDIRGPSYWESRKVVSILARCDSTGAVTSAEVFENNYEPSVEDSLLALVSRWTLSRNISRYQKGKSFSAVVNFAFDRTASTMPNRPERGIPPFVASALSEHPLSSWLDVWASYEPELELTDFVTHGYTWMRRIEGKGALDRPDMVRKREHGLLLTSSDGKWVLDPFRGLEVLKSGRAGWDVDVGWATYDSETGDRVHYWVSTFIRIDLARWVDSSVFVLLGELRVEHPKSTVERWVEATVPAVWVGDMKAEKIAVYLGAPPYPMHRVERERRLAEVRASVFPEIEW